jgi:hypothetical protein
MAFEFCSTRTASNVRLGLFTAINSAGYSYAN